MVNEQQSLNLKGVVLIIFVCRQKKGSVTPYSIDLIVGQDIGLSKL